MTNKKYISPELFTFFRELKENNDRAWFQANKKRYEQHVKEPLLAFISDFSLRLAEISPHYVADARAVGGSLFRIYRDVRFSKDKSPYKTTAESSFGTKVGKMCHAPGFYLHLEPDGVFAAAGIWHPDTKTLNKIRDAIVAHPERWQRLLADEAFSTLYQLEGESLKRAPKGYDVDHPLIEDLRRKDFIAVTSFTEEEACQPAFIDRYAQTGHKAAPFMEFLTGAIGLAW